MRNKVLLAQLPDRHLARRGQRVLRTHHQIQFIAIHHHRPDRCVIRPEAQHPDLHGMHQHIVCNTAGQRPLHRHLDPRVPPPELVQQRQQIRLVYSFAARFSRPRCSSRNSCNAPAASARRFSSFRA